MPERRAAVYRRLIHRRDLLAFFRSGRPAADHDDVEVRPGSERRLGQRLPIDGLWVTWHVGRRDTRPLHRRRHPLETLYGRVVDLSVSGAGIVAPTDPTLRVGSTLSIEAEGFRGLVAVHRIRETPDEGLTYYGLSFVDFPPKFTVAVYERLDALADASHRDLWERAR